MNDPTIPVLIEEHLRPIARLINTRRVHYLNRLDNHIRCMNRVRHLPVLHNSLLSISPKSRTYRIRAFPHRRKLIPKHQLTFINLRENLFINNHVIQTFHIFLNILSVLVIIALSLSSSYLSPPALSTPSLTPSTYPFTLNISFGLGRVNNPFKISTVFSWA